MAAMGGDGLGGGSEAQSGQGGVNVAKTGMGTGERAGRKRTKAA